MTVLLWHILSLRHILSPRRRVKFDAQPLLLSLWHILSLRGDKMCRKVHSLHVLSLLCQQHYNLPFPFLVVCVCTLTWMRLCARARTHVCVYMCVLMCICPWQRVRAHVCCCGLCLLSPPQSALNWNFVLLWVDYKTTAACSSVSSVKYDYRYRDRVKMWFDCVLWMSLFDWMAGMVWWDKR